VGRATAVEFGRHGASVMLVARDLERLHSAADDVCAAGGQAQICVADVSDPKAMEDVVARTEEEFGPIDVWVNNAMVSVFSPISEMTAEDYRQVTSVTYLGYVNGVLAVLPKMRERNHGVIVHVGSALAYRSIPLQSAYCAAKHAILGFHASLRTELMHEKSAVHSTMVQLPAVNTPQFDWVKSRLPKRAQPVPPIYQPEVPARAIYYAAHHPRREIKLGTSTLEAVVLNKFVPTLIDHYLARVGFSDQQTDEPENPTRPDNLHHPVAGNWGAHGRFDSQSSNFSFEFWLLTHMAMVSTIVAAGAAAATAGAVALRRR
jgi:short-subunit dehydrogenase